MNPAASLATVSATFLDASIEILPYFLLAIFLGALIEEFVSESVITRFLTGTSPGTMVLASAVGAALPLCTCGMVPLAVSLRRRGSDLKHTFAFLTAGAAVSVPVVLLTWKVLGGWWALVRFVASVVFGLVVGYASTRVLRGSADRSAMSPSEPVALAPIGGRTAVLGGAIAEAPAVAAPHRTRTVKVMRRFWGQVKEFGPWVLVSLVLAAVVDGLVPRHWIHVLYGQKAVTGSLLAALTGVPFYFCSGAELPLVSQLLEKGMGAGPAASMMLAVPIVNILTFGVVAKWLGPKGAMAYLAACTVAAALIGVLLGVWT
ncbi:MAG TPA: permease [Candidatus Eisenbacteria bacterium]|nr:permease [Candidatus Eisenbacteria bacterium]